MAATASPSSFLDSTATVWLTVPQAARRLGCGPRTVYKAITRGELQASPINARGDLRVSVAWLDAWVERRAQRVAS